MPRYGYQYETSPRKIDVNYGKKSKKKNKVKTKVTKQETSKRKSEIDAQKEKEKLAKQKEQERKQKKLEAKARAGIFIKSVAIFAIFFIMIFRNSIVDERFSQIATLKTSITELQKENNQLEINIQNSLNLNTIEQAAKELLGMQKLTNKQKVYISLSKKDYVEPKAEKVIINSDENVFEKVINAIKNIF